VNRMTRVEGNTGKYAGGSIFQFDSSFTAGIVIVPLMKEMC
jgi:hypothetical protein